MTQHLLQATEKIGKATPITLYSNEMKDKKPADGERASIS